MLQQHTDRGCARFRFFGLSVGLGMCLVAISQTPAAPPGKNSDNRKPRLEDKLRTLAKGSSAKEHQEQGIQELPLAELTPAQREQANQILESLSLFRELPTVAFEVDPEVHQFFLDHPAVAVSIWRAMKISKFQMTELQPGLYTATDNEGTKGQMEILHRDRNQVLVICEGTVKSPLVPGTIQAQTLLHLQCDFVKSRDDRVWSRNRVRMYVAFPSQTVEAAAKLISPVGNLIIDRNLREVGLFVHMMSAAMAHQPGWVEHLARRLEGVPKERQADLIQLTARVFVTARKRALAQKGDDEVTLEDIIRPLQTARDPAEEASP